MVRACSTSPYHGTVRAMCDSAHIKRSLAAVLWLPITRHHPVGLVPCRVPLSVRVDLILVPLILQEPANVLVKQAQANRPVLHVIYFFQSHTLSLTLAHRNGNRFRST